MGQIKPAEVSAILLDELTNFENEASLDVKGTVLNVGDGVARVYGMRDAEAGELVEFEKNGDNPHPGVAESIGYLRGVIDGTAK